MECPSCGFDSPVQFRFCGKCGASLSGDPMGTGASQARWAHLVATIAARDAAMDIGALVQQVLRQSYLEATEDLRYYAEKVRYLNSARKAIRNHISDMRDELRKARNKSAMRVRTITLRPNHKKGENPVVRGRMRTFKSREQLENYICDLEEKLQTLGDDAQLANIDLQNMLQKQQQTLQLMSNVSKMLHDTSMAVIRKIG